MQKQLDNRLRRLTGQFEKLHASIEGGADCTEVIPQFLAVRGALTAAFALYVKESASDCAQSDPKKLEKLLDMLVKS